MLKIMILINLALQIYLMLDIIKTFNSINLCTLFSIIMSIIVLFKI